ncbi:MAG: DUF3352 domain-containing protein [Anaerolineae bacterium]
MKERKWLKFFLVIGLVAVLLFNFGCVELRRFVSEEAEDRIAYLMPGDTAFYFSLNLGREQSANFEQLWQVFAAIPGVEEATSELGNLTKGLPTEEEFSFENDIAPWLSLEAGLALPTLKLKGGADLVELSEEQPVIIVLASRDTAKSNAFLRKVGREIQKEGKLEMRLYKGTALYHYEPKSPGETPTAYAAYEDFLLLSNDLKLLQQVIDIAQEKGKSLAENEDYKALLKTLPPESAGHVYIAMGQFLKDFSELADIPPGTMDIYSGRAMAFSLGFIQNGLVMDYAASYDLEKMSRFMHETMRQKPNLHRALGFAPAETIFYLSGQDLSLLWEYVLEMLGRKPGFREGVQDLEKELDLNLEQDVFSWTTGEYALSVLPDPGGFMGQKDVPLGLLILVEIKDKKMAQDKMEKIAGALAEQLMAQPKEVYISGVKMHTLSVPSENITLGYGFIEDFLAIGTSRQILRQAVEAPDHPIKEMEELQAAIEPLPAHNTGYIYLDIQKTFELITRTMPPSERLDFQREVLPYVQPFRAFSSANMVMEEGKIMYGRLFILIEK